MMTPSHPSVTSGLAGMGGVIKASVEDFRVDEIPSYLPSGSGEHCYLTIEKQGITTLEAIHRIAKQLKISERDIGYAGMKDAVGITRQTISVQWLSPEKAREIELDGVRVVGAARHTNKLKLGHLKGNRFRIVVRGVEAAAAQLVQPIVDILATRGVPNYFGSQRYGAQGNSHLIGMALLRGDWQGAVDRLIGDPAAVRDEQWSAAIAAYGAGALEEALRLFPRHCRGEREVLQRLIARPDAPEKAFSVLHPRLKKMYLSAAQSFLFDEVVARRIDALDRIITGDLAYKHGNGACFLVEEGAVEQGRCEQFEISPSGPMFGCKMKQPAGEVWQMEEEILTAAGITLASFDLPGGLRMEGERRALRVPLEGFLWNCEGDCLSLEFSLPRGSYATSVMREITKGF